MEYIDIIDRLTGKREKEKIYFPKAIHYLYGGSFFGSLLCTLTSKIPLISHLYGLWMKNPWTKRYIDPFIKKFDVDAAEFEKKPEAFGSFNDFFIRKLKRDCRPMPQEEDAAIIPADGRYYFYPDIDLADGFLVKGKKFSLEALLRDRALAEKYRKGAMVLGRLCPSDYHRFHFPCRCIPGESTLINGYLYAVNPIAVKRNIEIFTENKRMITKLQTSLYGEVLYIEIGATNVGSVIQSYLPGESCRRGDEKGFFSFGASAVILLFEPQRITFAPDLIEMSHEAVEVRCLMGQVLGMPSSGSAF